MTRSLKGRPLRMAILDYGLFKVHENGRVIGISGFLIETDAGERVLVDTGFPEKYARDAEAAARDDDLDSFGSVLSLTRQNLMPGQLEVLGIAPEEIDLMVQSHTHIDHVGFMEACPDAPMVIGAAERALPRPLYWSDNHVMGWPERPYIRIERDTEIGPGFRVCLAPGHTPGQLAFLLDLPVTGSVLLTSDAISRAEEIGAGFPGAWDVPQARESGARLMDIAKDREALVIFGHCPDQWPGLRKAPNWYG